MVETPPPDVTTAKGRVVWILDNLFGGNQREMARAIGVSQASLSRVVSGLQEPGRRLIVAMATLATINDTWVYTGRGEPLLTATRVSTTPPATWSAPIADRILPGRPADHPLWLTGSRFPIAPEFFAPGRYWLQYSPEFLFAPEEGQRYQTGDLLLMESDPDAWKAGPDALRSRLCAVRIARPSGAGLVLVRWGVGIEHEREKLGFDEGKHHSTPVVEPGGSLTRALTFDDEIEKGVAGPFPLLVTMSDVIAVIILMIRPFGV